MNILIVEDDQLLSLMMCRMIEKMNHQVVDAVTKGELAVEKVGEYPVDLILMDIILEGEMDGIDAIKEIKQRSEIPVIYVTGNSDPLTIERAKETNFIAYLVKPVTEQILAETIQKVA